MPSNTAYGAILHFRRLDAAGVFPLLSRELTASFAGLGMPTRIIDYYDDFAAVGTALADPDCRFFLCYNGFGSEIRLRDGGISAYSAFGKPLIDFMHDCPANDAMQHQAESSFAERHLFFADISYVALAHEMGFANARFIRSITYPGAIGDVLPWHDRPIEVLFPASLPDPDSVLVRFRADAGGPRDRLVKTLFDQAVARVSDWRLNPIEELRRVCCSAGFPLDFARADTRFLFSAVADYMHIVRRRELLAAISHLPVTVMSAYPIPVASSALKLHPPGNITEAMRLMAQSKAVLCPPAHPSGFHERALGALGAGALTIEASNRLVEALFRDGEDILFYENAAQAAAAAERVFAGDPGLADIAAKGRSNAAACHAPRLAAVRFLSAVEKFHRARRTLPLRAPPGPGDLFLPPTVKVSGLSALYDPPPPIPPAGESADHDMPPAITYMMLSQEYGALCQSRLVRLAIFLQRVRRRCGKLWRKISGQV